MDRDELVEWLEAAAASRFWHQFVATTQEFVEDLDQKYLDDDTKYLDQLAAPIEELLFENQLEHIAQLLAVELYASCAIPRAVEQGLSLLRRSAETLVQDEAPDPLNSSLLSSVLAILWRLRENRTISETQWRDHLETLTTIHPAIRASLPGSRPQARRGPPNIAGFLQVGPNKVLPGDCLFRDMGWKPISDLGHVAIYIGIDPNDDPDDESNHLIIEVTTATPACNIDTVANFKKTGTFWGYYSVDLTSNERDQIVNNALKYNGKCSYGYWPRRYKSASALSFRCDGFVEYCYESITPTPGRLSHRKGLFEADTWKSLTPAALRNCMFIKLN